MDVEDHVRRQVKTYIHGWTGMQAVDNEVNKLPLSEFLSLVSSAIESRLYELKED